MAPPRAVSIQQEKVLIDLLQGKPEVMRFSGNADAQSKLKLQEFWESAALKLNAVGYGCTKSGKKWRDYWRDRKCSVKKKASELRRYASGTGGGPARKEKLSDEEERILSMMGNVAVFGEPSVQIPFFSESTSSQVRRSSPLNYTASTSPPQRSTSPPQRSTSPPHRSTSPPQRSTSPPQRSTSPPQRSKSPRQRAATRSPTCSSRPRPRPHRQLDTETPQNFGTPGTRRRSMRENRMAAQAPAWAVELESRRLEVDLRKAVALERIAECLTAILEHQRQK